MRVYPPEHAFVAKKYRIIEDGALTFVLPFSVLRAGITQTW